MTNTKPTTTDEPSFAESARRAVEMSQERKAKVLQNHLIRWMNMFCQPGISFSFRGNFCFAISENRKGSFHLYSLRSTGEKNYLYLVESGGNVAQCADDHQLKMAICKAVETADFGDWLEKHTVEESQTSN